MSARAYAMVLLFLAASCGSGDAPTYHRDVRPILETHCTSCHQSGAIGGFDLTGYDATRARGVSVLASVSSGMMPPWPPAPGLPFLHERRLSDVERETLREWVTGGMPEGNPSDYVEPSEEIEGIRVDAEIPMARPYRPQDGLTDDYRCFVLDPQLERDTAVVGFDIVPGNRRIVHHIILYAVAPSDFGTLDRRETEEDEDGYTCFGGPRVSAMMLGAWVPGTTATRFPSRTGIVLEKGSRFVMQVHYNTLEVAEAEDLSTVQLQYATPTAVSGAYIIPLLQDDFRVEPEEVQTVEAVFDTSEVSFLPAGVSVRLHGLLPHMHMLGRSIRVTVDRAGGGTETLIDIPRWDFHWQQMYFYEEPVVITKGDVLRLECVFDNRSQNQPVVNGERLQPRPIEWGEGSLDEMCLNYFYGTF